MDPESSHVGRKFGFNRVLWEIRNYCITSDRLYWKFSSSEIYVRGLRLTKWRMFVTRYHISGENYEVVFHLQRLECKPHYEKAWAECVLEYSDHLGRPIIEEFQSYFKVNQVFKKVLRHASITPVSAIHSNVFELKCEILVHFSDIFETIPPCENIGIRRLSEDLHNLYENGLEHDLKLQLVDSCIYAHKAILFHRIKDLAIKSQITQDGEVIINVEDFTFEAVDKVVRFLYSGNIKHAVTLPVISVFKFAELLNVRPIIAYYDPDEIAITTTIEVNEYYETWTIKDFYNRSENFLVGPVMTNKNRDMKWHLKVYPKGFGREGKYVGIFIDIAAEIPKEICIEFFVKDELDRRISYRNHKRIEGKEVFGFKNFIKMDNVKNYMRNDSLTVGLRLRMPTGKENISIGESIVCYEQFSAEKCYDQLSKDILCLYKDSNFHNMQIILPKHNTILYAHEYFLNERCLFFSQICRDKRRIDLNDINLIVIKEIFSFLYSGKLNEDISLEDIFCLYQTANKFNITTLKCVVMEKLKMSLNESNAKSIYEIVNSGNIESLRDYLELKNYD